jgi:threonine/homoserine/homoserine lactone efflux protein
MTDRWERLRQFPVQWPALGAAQLAGALRWLTLIVGAAGLLWLAFGLLRARAERSAEAGSNE